GGEYFRDVFIGSYAAHERPKEPQAGKPTLYLVTQPPHTEVPPHYHAVAQWQVVVGGSAYLGRHHAASVSIHFTDPLTAYGPITATDQGVRYFTFRTMADPGAQYTDDPAARERLLGLRRKNRRFIFLDS